MAFYADNHRIHVGSDDTIIDMVYSGGPPTKPRIRHRHCWPPPTRSSAQLNERARLDRLLAQTRAAERVCPADTREVALCDGLRASVGDIVATRRNKRSLRLGGG
ncbi:hypothetical protein, partial [Mycobacterium riyadhense]|uniref:hypothetical protein n=1 Tax=Mycobacterium riyadhense TaxID=486698 RepID=UPI00195AE7C1